MKRPTRRNSLLGISFILVLIALTLLRASVDRLPFINALDHIINVGLDAVWLLLSNPTIFVATVAAIVLWIYRPAILAIMPGIKELKAGPVSATFTSSTFPPEPASSLDSESKRHHEPATAGTADSKEREYLERAALQIGKETCLFLLGLDKREISFSDFTVRYKQEIKGSWLDQIAPKDESNSYFFFHGVLRTLLRTVFPIFIDWTASEDDQTAYFTLPSLSKTVLEARIKKLDARPQLTENQSTA